MSLQRVAIVWGPTGKLASKRSIGWSLDHFIQSLTKHDLIVNYSENVDDVANVDLCIIVADSHEEPVKNILEGSNATVPSEPESFTISSGVWKDRKCITVTGSDTRGYIYALLELSDRMDHCTDPVAELSKITTVTERPATPVRSVARLFSSEIEDKPWFYKKQFWKEYFTELAIHRFNKFQLALGMAVDSGHDPNLKDNYFFFAYPFFVSVPGYDVSVRRLSKEEQKKNLEMLQFISSEAKKRGIHFQLGLWIHDYLMNDSPDVNYIIEGVTADNHASYCRDALLTILNACPDIDGVTLRVHYESGVPEPAHEFWDVVLSRIHESGRRIEIDLHTKGVYDEMLQVALDTKMPVKVSAKYHAEHTALPYHQSAIRESERVARSATENRARTTGDRIYTRYGYADFLKNDRPYQLIYRIWPGSQRLLLWADPVLAAGYGRYGNFDGSKGIEVMEPLTFKGRKDSGYPNGRDPYLHPDLQYGIAEEWRKYKYYYRVWGRALYNPDIDPDSWRRFMRTQFGEAALNCEESLAHASRIIPLIISSHLPSAAQAIHWSEMPTNMTLSESGKETIYYDTPQPRTFGTVSPHDPAMFYGINEFVDAIISGNRKGKYSPIYVASVLDQLVNTAERQLLEAENKITAQNSLEFKRLSVDIRAVIGLGRFFSNKFRAGIAYALFKRTGVKKYLQKTVEYYELAKEGWLEIVSATKGVYKEDIAFGSRPFMRGHWSDRVQDIEEDIAIIRQELDQYGDEDSNRQENNYGDFSTIFEEDFMLERPRYVHEQASSFNKGEPVPIKVTIPESQDIKVLIHYRHVNQAEAYVVSEMNKKDDEFSFTIPGDYTDSPYSLIYFFEIQNDQGEACIVPGLDDNLANQPYYHLPQ